MANQPVKYVVQHVFHLKCFNPYIFFLILSLVNKITIYHLTKCMEPKTTEASQLSLIKQKKRKTLPFTASIQHVRNVNQCEQCGKWRLIYSPHKSKAPDRRRLEGKLDNFAFSCGANFEDLDLPEQLLGVCVRELQCEDPVEKLYYSMGYDPICIHFE